MVIPVSKPKVSPSEKKYREELFPDVKEIKNKNLLCTSCGGSVKDLISKGRPIIHPFLETLLCEKCHSFYGDGQFSVDEDGSDKYCRWCGQGGTLFLCSQCSSGFCKRCVKRNLPKSAQAKIEDDDWVCYCCDTAPLYELRAQCWAAQQYAAEYVKNKGSSKSKRNTKDVNKRSQDSDISDIDDEVQRKKKRKAETKKKTDKKERNGEQKEGSGGGGGRTLRKRDSKVNKYDSGNESDNQLETASGETLLPSGVSIERINAALTKLSGFIADIASMTKEAHKKLLECKNKKMNLKSINSVETVSDMKVKLSSMMMSLETNVQKVRQGLEGYVDEWMKTVQDELMKAKEKAGGIPENKVDDNERLENGLPPEDTEESKGDGPHQEEAMEVEESISSKDTKSNDESTSTDEKSPSKKSTPSKEGSGDTNEETTNDNDDESVSDKKSGDERIPLAKDGDESKEGDSVSGPESRDSETKSKEDSGEVDSEMKSTTEDSTTSKESESSEAKER